MFFFLLKLGPFPRNILELCLGRAMWGCGVLSAQRGRICIGVRETTGGLTVRHINKHFVIFKA